MIEKYTDIKKLTVPMINEYIEKVVGPISSFLKLAGLSKKQVTFKTVPFPSVSCNTGMASFEKRIKVCEGEVPAACRFER